MPTSHTLPPEWTSFVGRERELAALRDRVGSVRLLTLTGPGGVGKTRLGLRVAAAALDDVPDGVYLAELAAIADPSLVPGTVATALGIAEAPGQDVLDVLAASLADLAPLLVLDNCEHLVQACAELVEHLLRAAPGLRILATSRAPLGVPGEQLWRVAPLGLPDVSDPPERIEAAEAVRLFVERATLVRPDFAPDAQHLAAIAQVCRLLDGLPLAIELAAARVSVLTVDQITQRLSGQLAGVGGGSAAASASDVRFRLLTGGTRGAPARQRTLRGLIDWSYDLLTEPERTLLRRLAVFASGATLDAAEAVCAGDGVAAAQVLDLLTALVDSSLAYAEEAPGGEMRFRLLRTIQAYAEERLCAAGEEPRLRRRHAEWALDLAEQAEPELRGPAQRTWLARLATVHDELRAALGWAARAGDATTEVRLAGTLSRFWFRRGFLEEGQRALEGALGRAEGKPVAAAARAKALVGAGLLAGRRGQSSHATQLFEQGLALARQAGDALLEARAMSGLGHMAFDRGDLPSARAAYTACLAMYRAAQDWQQEASTLHNLGNLAKDEQEYAAAQALYEESLAISRAQGDEQGEARELLHLALLAITVGEPRRGTELCAESLRHLRALGDRFGIAEALEQAGRCSLLEQRAERAAMLLAAAEGLRAEVGAPLRARATELHARDVAQARAALGEATFGAAWYAGQRLSAEAAIDLVLEASPCGLEDVAGAPADSSPAAPPADLPLKPADSPADMPLTRRERELAVLVARGLTNREIAEQLVIAEGTTERHLANIFSKLGLSSRARLAAWAVERGLVGLPVDP